MEISVSHNDLKQDILNLFDKNACELGATSGEALNKHRSKAYDDLLRIGIPTTKNEAYKYTPIDTYLKGDYKAVSGRSRLT
jgi:hypothetical protein